MHSISASTCCVPCGSLSSWWLLASLARRICRWHYRFVILKPFSQPFRTLSLSESRHGSRLILLSPFSGLTVSSFCYLQFFPYPFDADGTFPFWYRWYVGPWSTYFTVYSCSFAFAAVWPHAYFQQLADTQSNGIANSYNMGPTDIEIADEGHGAISLRDTSPILDTMESGRRGWNMRRQVSWCCVDSSAFLSFKFYNMTSSYGSPISMYIAQE